MPTLTSLDECLRAIIAFLISSASKLPATMQQALMNAQSQFSPVGVLMETIEALYAARADLDDDGRMLLAALIEFALPMGWYEIQKDNRGGRIQMAMFRDSGMEPSQGTSWPDPSTDPEVAFQYRPLPTITTIIEPPAPEPEPQVETPPAESVSE